MINLEALIARAKELSERATKGPWRVEQAVEKYGEDGEPEIFDQDSVYGIDSGEIRIIETDAGYYPPRKDDAAFIVFAREAVPALAAALEEALKQNARDPLHKAGFNHPCMGVCSGWKQGYDRGFDDALAQTQGPT